MLITVRYSRSGMRGVFGSRSEVTKRPFPIQDSNPYRQSFGLFQSDPEQISLIGEDGRINRTLYNQTRSAKKMLNIVVSELILYDMKGNVVLTLNDIEEEDFEYTDQQQRLSPCIMVTRKMVQLGRRKYAGIVME